MFFAPQGRHVAPMGVKFGTDEGTALRAKFHSHRCNDKGIGPTKLKSLLRFDRNVEYKHPAGAFSLRFLQKFAGFVPRFRVALALKIWLDLLSGLRSSGGFKLRELCYSQIFSTP